MDNEAEFATELEVLEAMYPGTDELEVQLREDSDGDEGPRATMVFRIHLERARVELYVELPAEFPCRAAPRVQVKSSRGLIDSQETQLKRALDARAEESLADQGKYSLVDVLLAAQERVQEMSDKGGRCAVCLCTIEAEEAYFRAMCWHVFHAACLAAWWKQLDARRSAAGTDLERAALQRDQALRAVEARVAERTNILEGLTQRIAALREEKRALGAAIEADPDDPERANMARRMTAIDEEVRAAKKDIPAAKTKLDKAVEDRDRNVSHLEAQAAAEERQGIQCPMCCADIPYDEAADVLAAAATQLKQEGATLVPEAWHSPRELGPEEKFVFALSEAERERMDQERERRAAIFAKQRAKGALVNPPVAHT